jgi:hypothetical protein
MASAIIVAGLWGAFARDPGGRRPDRAVAAASCDFTRVELVACRGTTAAGARSPKRP